MAILFADVARFSQLTDAQLPHFVKHFLGLVAVVLKGPFRPVTHNTWGDGLYAVFRSVKDAGLFALDLSERVTRTDWEQKRLPPLTLRIALHTGPVYRCYDPAIRKRTYMGTQVSRAARIEPITPEGEVYASQEFAATAAAERVTDFVCDYAGLQPLPKGTAVIPAYHVRRGRR